jgi:hypothetical protein
MSMYLWYFRTNNCIFKITPRQNREPANVVGECRHAFRLNSGRALSCDTSFVRNLTRFQTRIFTNITPRHPSTNLTPRWPSPHDHDLYVIIMWMGSSNILQLVKLMLVYAQKFNNWKVAWEYGWEFGLDFLEVMWSQHIGSPNVQAS